MLPNPEPMGKGRNSRPLLVTLVAILNILIGLAAILVGGVTFAGLTILGGIEIGAVTGGTSVAVGLIYILVGVGFLGGWSIMWYLGIVLEGISVILNIMSIFVGNISAIVSILISLIIILYLLKPNVKRYFLG